MEIAVSLLPFFKHLLYENILVHYVYFLSLDFETAGYMGIAFAMEECMDMDMDMGFPYFFSFLFSLTHTSFSHVYSSCTDQRMSGHHSA